MRPFRFLAQAGDVVDGRTLTAHAQRVESLGYSGLVIADHLIDQLAEILEIDVVGAFFAVDILNEPMIYFDPVFLQSLNKTMVMYEGMLTTYRAQQDAPEDDAPEDDAPEGDDVTLDQTAQ